MQQVTTRFQKIGIQGKEDRKIGINSSLPERWRSLGLRFFLSPAKICVHLRVVNIPGMMETRQFHGVEVWYG